jgi:hypothetical protein
VVFIFNICCFIIITACGATQMGFVLVRHKLISRERPGVLTAHFVQLTMFALCDLHDEQLIKEKTCNYKI